MKAELVPENGDPAIPIRRDVTVVGRREYCDVRIDDPSLSKRHCVLVKTDGLLVVRDLATTNGTKVKGQRIRWAALLPDDRLTLGGYKVRVYLGPDNLPGPSERPAVPVKGQVRAGRPAAPSPAVAPGLPAQPDPGFPAPSPLNVPAAVPDGLEIADDSSDSGWRHIIASRPQEGDEEHEFLIELD